MRTVSSTMLRKNVALPLFVLLPLLGAARGCGGDEEPAILGELDAGVDLSIAEDLGASVDLGDASDMGAAIDSGTPRTLVGSGVSNTDTDYSIVIRVGADGDPRIIHNGEAGLVYYTRATAGVWPGANVTVDQEPNFGFGCDMYASAVVDSSNNTHIAYRYIPTGADGVCSDINDSEIRYVKVTGDTVGTPITIETVPGTTAASYDDIAPGIAVDASGTAHIVYRMGTAGFAELHYASVTAGVATAASAIPDSTCNNTTSQRATTQGALVPGVGPDGTLYVLGAGYSGTPIQVLRKTGAGWQPHFEVPSSDPIATAAVGPDGTLHVVTRSSAGDNYYTVTDEGVSTLVSTLNEPDCPVRSIAVNSHGEPGVALSCGSSSSARVGYTTFSGGAWSPILTAGLSDGDYADPRTTPSIAFDSSDVPHIAYQGFIVAHDLYYATLE